MSAQNENDIIAVEIIGDDIPVITQAELLATDYTGDEGAEFLCELYNTINYMESYLENPEDLICPDENQDGDLPYIIFIEKLNELMNYSWAKRTFTRMTRLAGAIQETQRLTQLQKSEHPDYIQCPNCLDYFLNKRNGLEKHMMNPICAERNARMFVKGNNDKKLPSGKYLHTVMVMDNLIGRSIAYKKNIEPELATEEIDDYAYVLKTYEMDGEYGGLFELDGNKEFNTPDEAQEVFDVAISTGEFSMIEFIRIDPNSNEHRETIIDVWNNYYKSEDTYVVKVYLGDEYQHNYIYNEKGSWSDQEEAKEAFRKAIECQEYSSIELVCKKADDDYDEQLMDEWETDDTCYECGRPLPDGEYLNGEDLVCYHCWGGETTKTDSEEEDEDEEIPIIPNYSVICFTRKEVSVDVNGEPEPDFDDGNNGIYDCWTYSYTQANIIEDIKTLEEATLKFNYAKKEYKMVLIDSNEDIIKKWEADIEIDEDAPERMIDNYWTEKEEDEQGDDECEFCAWRSEYPESHIQYGNVKCEYITDKYNIVFNEDGEIHSVLRNPV